MLPSAAGISPTIGIEPLVLMLTGADPGPSVGILARNLAALAPASIRRDAEQFASRIGASR